MNRQLWLATAVTAITSFATADGLASDRPNILMVLTDDQGFGDVRSHGNRHIETPTLDRLAQSGARFDRFFVSPVCAPTRASLLTGRWHLRTGVHGVTRARETMRADEVTLAEILREAGYATGAFGKWHNGAHYPHHPNGQGFDLFYGFCGGHRNNYFDSHLERNGRREEYQGYLVDRLTDEAIAFIAASKDRPWFCYVPYQTPHSPWQVPDRYWNRFRDNQDLPDDRARCAYAMVQNIDDNLGRLLQAVEDQGQMNHTIVVFVTDNGANSNRFNAGMKGRKGSLHEGGTRVPFFIRWDGRIPRGTRVPQIAAHIDVVPTLAELAQVPLPRNIELDGVSLVPLLDNPNTAWPPRTLFAHWGDDERAEPRTDRGAVRTQRWRAVMYGNHWELYDMQQDPSQTLDVANQHPQILSDLEAQYHSWFKAVTQAGFAPIPTEVGHQAAPLVILPGHEARLVPAQSQGIRYQGRAGWANDYVTGWTNKAAYPAWSIRVVRPVTLSVSLDYAADEDAVGNQIQLSAGSQHITVPITKACAAARIPSPDRVPRKEVFEREWGRMELGTLTLEPGLTEVSIRCVRKNSVEVMELKSVRLESIDR